ncbi:MAG: FGGY-family carbohydrate kinase [Bryobacterales bacterium]
MVEGVSYSLKDCLDIVESLGVEPVAVRASGGGARSPFWRAILAGVFAKPIATLQTQEGSACRAALLGMVGSGQFGTVEEACQAMIRGRPAGGGCGAREDLRRGPRGFRELHPALKPSFPKM